MDKLSGFETHRAILPETTKWSKMVAGGGAAKPPVGKTPVFSDPDGVDWVGWASKLWLRFQRPMVTIASTSWLRLPAADVSRMHCGWKPQPPQNGAVQLEHS